MIDDPNCCRKCGCNQVFDLDQIERTGTFYGPDGPQRVRSIESGHRCGFCGRRWTTRTDWEPIDGEAGELAVEFHPVKCPQCRGKKTPVTRTARPVRYHRCSECGHTFKSVER